VGFCQPTSADMHHFMCESRPPLNLTPCLSDPA
jgi:hypothetical protein